MICPDTTYECDNPGCRHGGCQGRRPDLPLLRLRPTPPVAPRPASIEAAVLRNDAAASLAQIQRNP